MRPLRVLAVLVALLAVSAGPAGASAVRLPPAGAGLDYQLGGAYRPATGVGVVSRDRLATPAPGLYNLCYVNAFQTQPGRLRWWREHHPRVLLREHGTLVRDPDWPDEVLLDTSTRGRRDVLAKVLAGWEARCARDGFDAVEPDNLDSWTRSRHLLTRADNLALARRIVAAGHAHGLAVAQKNTAELTAAQVGRTGFDLAVAEECEVYLECGRYRSLYGRHVLEVEYADDGDAPFERACAKRGGAWSIVQRDRDLLTPAQQGYVRRTC